MLRSAKRRPRIAVIGHGVVGRHLVRTFRASCADVVVYDRDSKRCPRHVTRDDVNRCDLVFVAVPTPSLPAGQCDLSAVEDVVGWLSPPICLKSTVIPGTTDRLIQQTGKQIVFSPEYIGETPFHKYRASESPDLVVVGGTRRTRDLFLDLFRARFGPEPHYFGTEAITAELAKYMENCFLATKVAYVAQFYLLARRLGVDFTQLREIWVADTRIGRSHSSITGSLGFDGRCLPKDLSALIAFAIDKGIPHGLLESVLTFNERLQFDQLQSELPPQGLEISAKS